MEKGEIKHFQYLKCLLSMWKFKKTAKSKFQISKSIFPANKVETFNAAVFFFFFKSSNTDPCNFILFCFIVKLIDSHKYVKVHVQVGN